MRIDKPGTDNALIAAALRATGSSLAGGGVILQLPATEQCSMSDMVT